MKRSLSRRLNPKLPQRRTRDILTKSSQGKPSPSRHPDKMTAWSLLTASDDPTSHSSPTPPVGQPNMQISNIPRVPPSFPLSIRLHSQKGPSLLSLVLPPALSAQAPPPRRMSQSASRFCCCCLTGWRKCETKTKINVLLLGGL